MQSAAVTAHDEPGHNGADRTRLLTEALDSQIVADPVGTRVVNDAEDRTAPPGKPQPRWGAGR